MSISTQYPLTAAQCAAFQQEGFLLIKKMVADDVCAEMQQVALDHLGREQEPLEYEADLGYEGAPASRDSVGGRTVRRLRGAYQRDHSFRNWAGNPALLAMLRQLMGEPVHITLAHHNSVMTKHPHYGTATGWHRDIRYWSFAQPNLISVWLALGEENQHNGGLLFIPGSHRMDIARDRMDPLDFLRPELPENKKLCETGVSVPLVTGDVVLFHSGVFHAGGRNNTEQLKTALVLAYHGISNAPLPGSRSAAQPSILLG